MTKRNCLRLAALAVLLLGSRALDHVSANEGHKHTNAPASAKKLKTPLTAGAETLTFEVM